MKILIIEDEKKLGNDVQNILLVRITFANLPTYSQAIEK
jgi:hypothetical protein